MDGFTLNVTFPGTTPRAWQNSVPSFHYTSPGYSTTFDDIRESKCDNNGMGLLGNYGLHCKQVDTPHDCLE
jgi:hypothetical protein